MKDYLEFKDYLCFAHDKKIKKSISNEQLFLSEKLDILYTFDIPIGRNLIITNCALYNLDSKNVKKRIEIGNIIGITVSKKSNQFVVHQKFNSNDKLYNSEKRDEIISTIAEVFNMATHNKLPFFLTEEESLSSYVTSKKQKITNPNYTLMKGNNDIFIENILYEKNKIDEKIQKMVDDELEKFEKEKKSENVLLTSEQKELNQNLNSSKILTFGKYATSGGLILSGGVIFSCITIESIAGSLGVVSSNILLGAFWAGFASFGIGLIPLIGGATYLLFQKNKINRIKEFYKNFDSNEKKIEKEIREYVINKICKYYLKPIASELEKSIKNLNNHLNEIIQGFITIDNDKLDLTIDSIKESVNIEDEKNNILDKLNKDRQLFVKNYIKIRLELIKKYMTSTISKIDSSSFQLGIPLFKEFIKSFGPQRIDKKKEIKIDNNIGEIIKAMKEIFHLKMKNSFDNFDANIFKTSFTNYLKEKYLEKVENGEDNIEEKDFIFNCNKYIIDLISAQTNNWGIISFYMFFLSSIINLYLPIKEDNYKKMIEKIKNLSA